MSAQAYPDDLPDGPVIDRAEVDRLVCHPDIDRAITVSAKTIVEMHRGHWVMNRLVSDRGRFVLATMMTELHFREGKGGGFTAARLRDLAIAEAVCSPGRVTAFIAAMRLVGFLRPAPSADRRAKRLVPTTQFIDLQRERMTGMFLARAIVRPHDDVAALEDPWVLGGMMSFMLKRYVQGFRIAIEVPALRHVMDRDVGIPLTLCVVLNDLEGRQSNIAPLARRFSVSRSHVLTVIRELSAENLIEQSSARGGFRGTPLLLEAARRFFATAYLLQEEGIVHAKAWAARADRSGEIAAAEPPAVKSASAPRR
ncbi:hypothetical protein [Segnochrobactrum spirostomi]|uniref:Uncharacterized protein n=1 Tax=Segnochrobactrum spirostomi TaxID=2608987 RepID=A0A6A7Y412_9HYPH|nr:hypothetical protein [Segnochrobactrum spirostomi]MQT12459.1 hypothetical protein [Segnochrobactrum spirostomi]